MERRKEGDGSPKELDSAELSGSRCEVRPAIPVPGDRPIARIDGVSRSLPNRPALIPPTSQGLLSSVRMGSSNSRSAGPTPFVITKLDRIPCNVHERNPLVVPVILVVRSTNTMGQRSSGNIACYLGGRHPHGLGAGNNDPEHAWKGREGGSWNGPHMARTMAFRVSGNKALVNAPDLSVDRAQRARYFSNARWILPFTSSVGAGSSR